MNRVVHRQPVWGWSLILLSTFLLPPSTAVALLHALSQTRPTTALANDAGYLPAPRRSASEDEALRAAAGNGRLKTIRLEPAEPGGAMAVLVPTRGVVRVPDIHAPVAPIFPAPATLARAPGFPGPRAPRAPPA